MTLRSLVKNAAAVIIAVGMLSGCSDADDAFRTLVNAGYTNISITGGVWFGCDVGDTYRTGFVASSPAKATVNGVVCKQAGWWGTSVIRTYS